MTHLDVSKRAFQRFLDGLNVHPDNCELLDVGCGKGTMKQFFEDTGHIWHGIDKADYQLGENFSVAEMTDIPFSDNHFDIVACVHSFEHCERPIDALREFMRVLKSRGYLFISLPRHCLRQVLYMDADHIFVLPPENMYKLFTYVGFDVVSAFHEHDTFEYVNINIDMRDMQNSTESLIIIGRKK